jgi:hypothetical protein
LGVRQIGGIVQKKFRGLGLIGFLLKIIGVLELIVGLASLIILPLVFSDSGGVLDQFGIKGLLLGTELIIGIISGVLLFLIGLVCGLLTFSVGEIFNLLIAIEENTRVSRLLQEKKE